MKKTIFASAGMAFGVMLISFFLLLSSQLYSQDTEPSSVIIPGPEPFTLDGGSAIYCIDLLREIRFLELKNETSSEIVKVETVWSYYLDFDESYPRGHQLRYDIIVNGNPLDWDNSFIEYGGELINLRLLFLYKNQHPPKDLGYRNNP